MPNEPPTFCPCWEYVEVDSLVALQKGIARSEGARSNDEVMFIVVHPIDELWFKLVSREMVVVRDLFARPHVPELRDDATALTHRVFHELWAVRTMLVRAKDLPPLENPERRGFAGGV
jgi:tryptophan 2,3-dioxygenase